ncbi:MAG: LysR family transcriptional regulator [Alphaproteobacteria bacterium]
MKLSNIDLRLLQVFRAVAESGGFVRAQGVLGISQPTISSHIANLEQRLQLKLCVRGPQGFSLTAEGEEVLREAIDLLDYLDSATSRLKNISDGGVERLRLAVLDATVNNPDNPLPQALEALRRSNPRAQPEVTVTDFLACLSDLRSEVIEFALFGIADEETLPDDVEACFLFNEISTLYCSPVHPCAQADDAAALDKALDEATISAHSFAPQLLEGRQDPDFSPTNTIFSQGSLEATTYSALTGSHVGLLPLHVAAPWVEQGRLVRVGDDRLHVTSRFYLVRLKDRKHSAAAKALWSLVAQT